MTNEPIQDNFMSIDFNPLNIKDEIIKLCGHKIVFINPNKKYDNSNITRNIQDWINLFRNSMQEDEQDIILNLNNKGISKVTEIINYKNISPEKLTEIKIAEGTKAVLALEYDAGRKEGRKQRQVEEEKKQAEQKQQQVAEEEKKQAEQKQQQAEQEKQQVTRKRTSRIKNVYL